jgi:hypothetical protein
MTCICLKGLAEPMVSLCIMPNETLDEFSWPPYCCDLKFYKTNLHGNVVYLLLFINHINNILKFSWFILFKEIIAVYSYSH